MISMSTQIPLARLHLQAVKAEKPAKAPKAEKKAKAE